MIQPNSDQLATSALVTGARPTHADTSSADAAVVERAELTACVRRAQGGDMDAQSDLFRRYLRRIRGHVHGIIRQPDAVDDVTQTVFIKMVRRLGRLRDAALFECWLFTLSRNTALDFIRQRNRRPSTVAVDESTYEIADPDSSSTTAQLHDELDLALAQLSVVDRSLVTLYVQGNSYRTMASREGLTPAAVKARLHRVRPFLRQRLGTTEKPSLTAMARYAN